jgi:lipoprotein-anchoring transpeptidase ErfK/SrfK
LKRQGEEKMGHSKFLTGILLLILNAGCTSTPAVPHVLPDKVHEHITSLGVQPSDHIIMVDTKKQTLAVLHKGQVKKVYTISTSKRGIGQKINTFQTPQGLHRINEKIGHGIPHYGIFHRRKYIGTWQKQPRHQHRKDYVSTRILRLEGLQPGLNRGRDKLGRIIDSETRAIYIHGTTMEWKLGAPSTKGCVHMSAKDVIKLFETVPTGTLVWIH